MNPRAWVRILIHWRMPWLVLIVAALMLADAMPGYIIRHGFAAYRWQVIASLKGAIKVIRNNRLAAPAAYGK